jgi:hypothetical protein
MIEPQADEAPLKNDNLEMEANPEPQLDLVESDSEPETEKVTFTEAQQKVIDDLASKKTFKVREAERKAEQLQQELEAVQAKIPKETRPDIPTLPDPYSDDYEAQLAARDDKIRAAAAYDANESIRQQQAQQAQLESQQAQQAALTEKIDTYTSRAKLLGVDAQGLQAAAGIIQQYGIDDSVAMHIINDEHGPLITKYLSQNPTALDHIARSDPMSAAVYISTEVKAKASALSKKPPTAPDPVETLSGSGVAPGQRGPKGATFT